MHRGIRRSSLARPGSKTTSHLATLPVTTCAFTFLGASVGASLVLVPLLGLCLVLICASLIDLAQFRIPNRLVKPAGAILAIMLMCCSLLGSPGSPARAIAGALAFAGLLGAIHLAYPQGMGQGDVRLAAVLGLFLGYFSTDWFDTGWRLGLALLLASTLGLLSVLVPTRMNRSRTHTMSSHVPFGPALSCGAAIVLVGMI